MLSKSDAGIPIAPFVRPGDFDAYPDGQMPLIDFSYCIYGEGLLPIMPDVRQAILATLLDIYPEGNVTQTFELFESPSVPVFTVTRSPANSSDAAFSQFQSVDVISHSKWAANSLVARVGGIESAYTWFDVQSLAQQGIMVRIFPQQLTVSSPASVILARVPYPPLTSYTVVLNLVGTNLVPFHVRKQTIIAGLMHGFLINSAVPADMRVLQVSQEILPPDAGGSTLSSVNVSLLVGNTAPGSADLSSTLPLLVTSSVFRSALPPELGMADDDVEKDTIKPVKMTEWMPGPWNVRHGPVEGLLVGEMLGRGSYGRVYRGTWKGSQVAIKVIEFRANSEKSASISLESVLSTAVCHPCVAKGGKSQLMETWMVLEYCDKGSLEEALDNKWLHSHNVGLPDMASIYRCLLDIAGGMDYLHSVSILHGDLKTANVLLKSSNDDTRGYICKLADFGLSRLLDGSQTHISTQSYGTITHMPAELLRNGKMTRAVDVYSFGMLMWELCTGLPLYGGMTAPEVYHKVVYEGHRPDVPSHCPEAYAALMQRCWAEDPDARPTFDEVTKALQPLSDSVGPGSAPPCRVSLAPDETAQAAQTFRQALGDDSARAASPQS
ncbi:hypothetical protein WJX72_003004 [[Myrmecia] bisecta]|uniref:Protein kinase domain-containing protein n=1 Tax=[Myrmecia] bisecta TaxID=41462 RepID=A0AAW1R5A5_9CHLO